MENWKLSNLYSLYFLFLSIYYISQIKKNTFILFLYFLLLFLFSFSNHKPTNKILLPSLYYFLSYLQTILFIYKEKLPLLFSPYYLSLLFYLQLFPLTFSIYPPLFLSVIFPSIFQYPVERAFTESQKKIKIYERKKNRASWRVLLPGSFTIFVCDYVSAVIYPSVPFLSLARATTILIFVAFR